MQMYHFGITIHLISKTSVSKNSINMYCASHQELISYLVAYEHLKNLIWWSRRLLWRADLKKWRWMDRKESSPNAIDLLTGQAKQESWRKHFCFFTLLHHSHCRDVHLPRKNPLLFQTDSCHCLGQITHTWKMLKWHQRELNSAVTYNF